MATSFGRGASGGTFSHKFTIKSPMQKKIQEAKDAQLLKYINSGGKSGFGGNVAYTAPGSFGGGFGDMAGSPSKFGGGKQNQFAQQAQAMLEKFASTFDTFGANNRGSYKEQLNNIFAGNVDIEDTPGFAGVNKVMQKSADEALRKLAASGNLNAGGAGEVLGNVYHENIGNHYKNYLDQLMQMSGANFAPNQDAGISALMGSLSAASGGQAAQQAQMAQFMQMLMSR